MMALAYYNFVNAIGVNGHRVMDLELIYRIPVDNKSKMMAFSRGPATARAFMISS
jgi:hypothetical protein